MKTCSKCGVEKPESEFYTHSQYTNGLSTQCKDCLKQYKAEWYKKNKNKVVAKTKVWKENNRNKVNKYSKDWYDNNKERHKQACRNWEANNPIRRREMKRIAMQRRRGLGDLSIQTFREIKTEYNGFCPYCNEQIISGHLDHIIPVSKGGMNSRSNLVFCCASCNERKGSKNLLEFMLYRKDNYGKENFQPPN